ncbi:hypothetical protein JW823_06315 [bacterium]|nr:hypothetical protein [candidate division CSSED10-310 bacterium]
MRNKKQYEKPVCVDLGRVAPVLGNVCSFGDSATDECLAGSNFIAPTPTPFVCVQGNKDQLLNCTNGNNNVGGICSNGNNVSGMQNRKLKHF